MFSGAFEKCKIHMQPPPLFCFSLKTPSSRSLTANGDFFAVAGGDAVDVRQHPQLFPRLQQQLEDVARVQLLLGETLLREHHRGLGCSGGGVFAYFFVSEGLHEPDRLLHRQREGEVRPGVDIRHLDVLVAEISLPLGVPTDLILSEDVRDQIS